MTDQPKTLTEALDRAKTAEEFGGAILGFMRAYDQQRFKDEDDADD
jgi:hypothetical protein